MQGIFITFEGPEGSGKSTQAALLVEYLRGQGYDVVAAHEPGGTRVGDVIREILQYDRTGEQLCPETEMFLFEASRAQLVRCVILPALNAGKIVVCDRFADSTTAYQGYGRGFDIDKIMTINSFSSDELVPDLTILMDIDVELGFKRLAERNEKNGRELDRIERESTTFHEKVRAGYLDLAKRWPARFKVVEANRAMDVVGREIREMVLTCLKNHAD